MRTLRAKLVLGAALAAAAFSVHGAEAADASAGATGSTEGATGPTGSTGATGATGGTAACAAKDGSSDSDDLSNLRVGLDGVVGSAREPEVTGVVPPGTTGGIPGSALTGTNRITNYSVIASAGIQMTPDFGMDLRLPIEGGVLFGVPQRSTGGVGNLELSGTGKLHLSDLMNLELTLGVTIPTAGGDQVPGNANGVVITQGAIDQSGYDRWSVQRAVSMSRGLEDDELFWPNHLGINPKIKLAIGEKWKWHVNPWVKLDNLIATSSGYSYVGELLFGADLGVVLGQYVEPTVKVWANAPLSGADYSSAVAVVEPQLRFHFSYVNPYVGVILPFAGPITNPYDYGVRVGVTLAQWGEQEKAPSDRDGDCVVNTEDACPDVAGVHTDDPKTNGCPAVGDRDGDGIADSDDACPDKPGIKTGDPKTNGCPSDRDGDGIADSDDACPDKPGIKTDDPKTNGCPSAAPDRDKDGIADTDDACPDVPGVKSDNPKTNGCPADSDGDGIVDTDDACPHDAGPRDPDPKKNGCPLAHVENGEVKIAAQIKFKVASAIILGESQPIIEAIAKIMKEHPEITHVSVEGHTDNQGKAVTNVLLSKKRAAAVVASLVKMGIEKGRLSSEGFGQEKPLEPNTTPEGRAANRRVEFKITQKK